MKSQTPVTDQAAERLAVVGRALWSSVLIGGAPPATLAMRERMSHPRPGDLVLEISPFRREFDPDSIGTLLRVEGDRYVIEPLHAPGTEQGWRNAEFIALPDAATFGRPA